MRALAWRMSGLSILLTVLLGLFAIPAGASGSSICVGLFTPGVTRPEPPAGKQLNARARFKELLGKARVATSYEALKAVAIESLRDGFDDSAFFFLLQNSALAFEGNWYPIDYGRFAERLMDEGFVFPDSTSPGSQALKAQGGFPRTLAPDRVTDLFELNQFALELIYNGVDEKNAGQILGQTSAAKAPEFRQWNGQNFISFAENILVTKQTLETWTATRLEALKTGRVARPSSKDLYLDWWPDVHPTKAERNRFFFENLKAQKEDEPDLYFRWTVHRPEDPKKMPDGHYELRRLRKSFVDYRGIYNDPESTIQAVYTFLGAIRSHSDFFENVYKSYEPKVRSEIIKLVQEADEALPIARQDFGQLMDVADRDKVYGTVRIFDGTRERPDDRFYPWAIDENYHLPLEQAFKIRGLKPAHLKELDRIRAENPHQRIFEIGKLTLNGSRAMRMRTLKLFEYWFVSYYVSRYPDALFYVHVASEEHLKLYQIRYGFEIVETVKVPGSENVEYILRLPAQKLAERIRARVGLNPSP